MISYKLIAPIFVIAGSNQIALDTIQELLQTYPYMKPKDFLIIHAEYQLMGKHDGTIYLAYNHKKNDACKTCLYRLSRMNIIDSTSYFYRAELYDLIN